MKKRTAEKLGEKHKIPWPQDKNVMAIVYKPNYESLGFLINSKWSFSQNFTEKRVKAERTFLNFCQR